MRSSAPNDDCYPYGIGYTNGTVSTNLVKDWPCSTSRNTPSLYVTAMHLRVLYSRTSSMQSLDSTVQIPTSTTTVTTLSWFVMQMCSSCWMSWNPGWDMEDSKIWLFSNGNLPY